MGLNRWLGCIENPAAGREAELAAATPVGSTGLGSPVALGRRPKRVLIIGGGPAGLQAAISAAHHGHEVVVYEREALAGGQVHWAASVPNRAEFGDMIRNQLNELKRLEVKVALGHEVDAPFVIDQKPDVVIVATGSVPQRPYWAPPDGDRIGDVIDVLRGTFAPVPGHRVTVIDELGFHQATSVAEVLADRGCVVEIITPGMVVGQDLGITLDMEGFRIRAAAKGIALTPDAVVMGWDPAQRTLRILHHVSGTMLDRQTDWVVLAVPNRPDDALFRELADSGLDVRRIGDAIAPRRAHSAIVDGDRVGAAL